MIALPTMTVAVRQRTTMRTVDVDKRTVPAVRRQSCVSVSWLKKLVG